VAGRVKVGGTIHAVRPITIKPGAVSGWVSEADSPFWERRTSPQGSVCR